jgi:hypothetical protein
MRFYQQGEKVRLQDDTIAVVLEVYAGPYAIPAGQNIGGKPRLAGPDIELAGNASYKVRHADGRELIVADREVRNPPKE